jgi:hypothetical protein
MNGHWHIQEFPHNHSTVMVLHHKDLVKSLEPLWKPVLQRCVKPTCWVAILPVQLTISCHELDLGDWVLSRWCSRMSGIRRSLWGSCHEVELLPPILLDASLGHGSGTWVDGATRVRSRLQVEMEMGGVWATLLIGWKMAACGVIWPPLLVVASKRAAPCWQETHCNQRWECNEQIVHVGHSCCELSNC